MNQTMTPTRWVQCTSTFRTRSGYVFCTRTNGHKGDHRGTRAQWDRSQNRVPITLQGDIK